MATVVGALATVPIQLPANSKRNNTIRISLLHTNDVHSRIEPFPMDGGHFAGLGGVARRSTLINKIRNENKNVLLLDAGDIFQGTPYFNLFGGKLELEIMSKLGYDAGTFGNHEFDNGMEHLADHLQYANFPFLTSNYDFTGTVLEGKTEKFRIFNKQGIRIGIFGLGIDINGLVDPTNHRGMQYLDPIQVANEIVPHLRDKLKCNLIVCLSHLGYEYRTDQISDRILASQTQGIDLIIGGHTHTFLSEPVEIKNLTGNITLVNQTGFGGINLGRVDFLFDTQKQKIKHESYSYTLHPLLNDAEDSNDNILLG